MKTIRKIEFLQSYFQKIFDTNFFEKLLVIRQKGRISKRRRQEKEARQSFRKTNFPYPLIRKRTCVYHRVRNVVIIVVIIIIITELTHSKTILENTMEIEPQPVALDFKNLSQYSSRYKKNCLLNLCCSCCNTNLLQPITKLFGYSP